MNQSGSTVCRRDTVSSGLLLEARNGFFHLVLLVCADASLDALFKNGHTAFFTV